MEVGPACTEMEGAEGIGQGTNSICCTQHDTVGPVI